MGKAFLIHLPLPHLEGQGFKLVTFRPTVAWAWVAVPSLNTRCKANEHNETACTQALSDDMPSMPRPNLHPLLPYEMHLLYVIMLFEAHRQQDISSTSVFSQLIPSVNSTACCVIRSSHTQKMPLRRLWTKPPSRSFLQVLYQIRVRAKTGKWLLISDQTRVNLNMIDISTPTEGTAVEGWAIWHHKTCNWRNASTHFTTLPNTWTIHSVSAI